MATRKLYKVTIGGIEHDMLLDEQDAKRYGNRAELAGEADQALEPVDDKAPAEDVEEDEETVEEDELEDAEQPAGNASQAAWQEYARTQGATDEELEGMTRDQLRDAYGS